MKRYMPGDLVDMEPRHRYFVLTNYWRKDIIMEDVEFYERSSDKSLRFTRDLQNATIIDAERDRMSALMADTRGELLLYVPVTISKEGVVTLFEDDLADIIE